MSSTKTVIAPLGERAILAYEHCRMICEANEGISSSDVMGVFDKWVALSDPMEDRETLLMFLHAAVFDQN